MLGQTLIREGAINAAQLEQALAQQRSSGALLGAFRGEVVGVGGTAALNVVMGRSPATFRLRALKELDATNRLKGEAFFLSLTLPLYMKMPPQ